ncbi:HAD hydrolase-like protein [Streptomyces sp. ME02-6979-3A]|uniref:HAD family hydrolase n=1 Tax=unclassified Streptomyces TaxID=2593676 RepID=UPI0029B164FD|nr:MULTISPECIES: HAD hydrolase-like protein [unclassified Streptomyces]WSS62251.1 HAD hydrolase-like protein [Streptomyces sp. NBC_01177]WSS76290.1 HAD hydrolase-like protein [Streptomyces sp. NBC_01174]MDX3327611.1 HAD hydrolase-like protein [Streptomyces sp. ME02-6979-3A]MDX3429129.1 HAD hydrolase-like protein [Streptomyces sp. ME01-18a]MDX3687068.1 HAD hydrolase-like protein [Streptomyces sp. AK04-4c]
MATSGKHRTHLVWDWNGTLLDDIHAVLGATNAAFAEVDLEPLTLDQYREMYCVPIPKFYERLMGRLPTPAEWERMDGLFHRHYTEQRTACGLTEGVEELLTRWKVGGRSQSLLSMYGHEHLVPVVRGYGIERHFVRVDGRTGPSGGSKAQHMERHFEVLGEIAPESAVVIGDAVDDAVAAAHVGARAVLYTGGSHSRSSLEAAGVPVVDTLAEAVALAELMAD